MDWLEGTVLSGDHFKVNIGLPENHPTGLILNRDPRSGKKKPDAYAGVVVDASNLCQLVRVGDQVVFARWEWQQFNVDDVHMIARERDLIVVNDSPVNGHIIFELDDLNKKELGIIVPHTYEKPRTPTLSGKVLASAAQDINPGEFYIFEQMDSYQYHYGDGRMAFRINRGADIIAQYIRERILEVV